MSNGAITTRDAVLTTLSDDTTLRLLKDPAQIIAQAKKAAVQLHNIVSQKAKPVKINGEQYLEFEDWQTIGSFYGITADVEWTKPLLDEKGNLLGYEARTAALFHGRPLSHAEAECRFEEKNWFGRDKYALRSMAQTRAAAKALRNVLAWQVVLAGYKPTPAEELSASLSSQGSPSTTAKPSAVGSYKQISAKFPGKCRNCGTEYRKGAPIWYDYDTKRVLCDGCLSAEQASVSPPTTEETPELTLEPDAT